ncbi:histidinol dehydrogenase, partial [bacterium]|nr:histidinol dehydrogenase [bacterium]
MNAIPAQLAGVKQLIMATPPNHEGKISPGVLAAADCCGIDQIYKVGGAQAVFALAQGTQTIPKVDKIVGPGNIYVTKAKQMVYGLVDIDKPAGPSEVMVYVKDGKHAPYAASELLAQLEHDPLASGVILSTDAEVLKLVKKSLIKQMPKLNRQDVLTRSAVNGMLFLAEDEAHAIECINYVASEHLVLLFDDYEPVLKQINHAGSIFCGVYTPVTLGDYYAGPNHVLPTERAARFSSPLGVMDFVKYSSYMEYTKDSLQKAAPDIKALTDMEGFDAHYAAVDVRLS